MSIPTKDCLVYFNHEEDLTYTQIGQIFDVTKDCVYLWFKKYGIKAKNNQRIVTPKLSKEKRDIIKEKNRKFSVNDYVGTSELLNPELFENVGSYMQFRCSCGNVFRRKWYYAYKSEYGNLCKSCTLKETSKRYKARADEFRKIVQERKKNYNRSKGEIEVYDFCKHYYPNTQHSFSLGGKNYDIYIPDINLLIEYNGLYFHSERPYYKGNPQNKQLKYYRYMHKEKKDVALAHGMRCFQVWECDWERKPDVVKNFLLTIFNKDKERVFARKCKVVPVPRQTVDTFMNTHHLQGAVSRYSVSLGLAYGKYLVAIVIFAQESDGSMNLVRYAVDGRFQVIGGFARLLKHFQQSKDGRGKKIVTFADLTYVDERNNVYIRNGFREVERLDPDYRYVWDNNRVHKFNFRRAALEKLLGNRFNSDLSEYQNCINNDIYRVWDAGKIKFEKE